MFLLVVAHLGCPGHNPESHKMVAVVTVIAIGQCSKIGARKSCKSEISGDRNSCLSLDRVTSTLS